MTTERMTSEQVTGELPDTRARRRVATREALRQAALRLFAERGYEATTVRDIADAADVTERTFFRYFPTKADVLLGNLVEVRPKLLAALAQRPAAEPPLQAVLAAALSLPAPGSPALALLLPRTGHPFFEPDDAGEAGVELPAAGPAQPGGVTGRSPRLLQIFADWEAGLVDALLTRSGAADPPSEPDQLRAEVTARAALAALRTAIQHHHQLTVPAPDADPPDFHTILRASFAALGVQPPSS